MPDIDLLLRQARADDRAAMERICARTWEDGDYIPYVWDEWLADTKGPLVVGELDGEVVALCKITFQTADQVWLQGMRVDPNYRQRGIGRRFLDYSLAYAGEHGARVARLSTSIRNVAVHAMAARARMERIAVYVFWQAEALAGFPPLRILSANDRQAVEAFLATSRVLETCRGVYGAGWAWQELTPGQVRLLLEGDNIVAAPAEGSTLAALATLTADTYDQAIDIGLMDGDPAAVRELALAIRGHAMSQGAARARAWLPEVEWLREAFASAGYAFGEWKGEMCLYERRFEPHEGTHAG